MFLRVLFLFFIVLNSLNAVNSNSKVGSIPTIQGPIVNDLKSSHIKQKLLSEKKYKSLMNFSLGVSYFKEEKYAEAYGVLSKLPKIPYLGDYIKYYKSMSAFNNFESSGVLKNNLDELYSVLNNGDKALIDDIKDTIPNFEFKVALAFAKEKKHEQSFDYYYRSRLNGYSDLKSEFELIKTFLQYNKDLAFGLMLDLNRRFKQADINKLFETLPENIKEELFSTSSYKLSIKDKTSVSDYRKAESDLVSSIKTAIDSSDYVKFRDLGIEYLKAFPQGSYSKKFYDISFSFIENSIIKSGKTVSFYKDLFSNYEKNYLEKLVVRLFQKTSLDEVESLLKILLNRYPAYDKIQYLMASLQEDKDDKSKAIKYYKNIVNGFPKGQYYQRSLFKYAWLEMMENNYSNSIDLFSRYIEEGKENYDWSVTAALYFKARCLDKRSKKEEAKLVRQELISSFPYSFYSLLSMEEEGISLSEHIKSNIKALDTSAEPISPMELKTIQTAIMLIRAGVSDMAIKELTSINLDKLSPGYVEVVTNIYKHSANPDMTIMAAGKLMNILKGYASQEHAETHFPKLYFDNVRTYSDTYNFSPFVMLAIMKRESAFRKDAVSSAGALGLMQMMPDTAQSVDPKIKVRSLTDPDKNIKVAATYLQSLIRKYNGDLVYVLASYNAGDDALTRWINWYGKRHEKIEFIENIPYLETRNYVKSVISNYYMYNALYLKKDISFKDILKIGE